MNLLELFRPSESTTSLLDIDIHKLAKKKKLILLDMDNTLVRWDQSEISQEHFAWIKEGQKQGLKFCIISNTHNRKRLSLLAAQAEIPFVQGLFKPCRQMFHRALMIHGCNAEEAIMIGDQLLTDILGANRMNIQSIWLKPLSEKEFIGTKINRFIEHKIFQALTKRSK